MTAQIVPLRPAYGATAEEWTWAELVIGAADLLPVVSNPNAVISEGSTLKALGKTPSIYNRNGRVAGIPKWSNPEEPVTAAEIEQWRRQPDYGLCIRTGEIVALDLDDADQAGAMAALVTEHLGVLPVRSRPNSGRRIIAFRVAGGLSKRSFKTAFGLVEQLGRGQHFVACGTHVSGVRYTWEGGLPSDFPVVSREALDACWAALEARFATEATVAAGAANDRSRPDLEGVEDDVVDYLDEHGLILGRGDGKVFVACPWKDQHSSDNGISETAWLVAGGGGYERGHFKCQHTSHGQKTRAEFLDAIGYRASGFMPLADPDAPRDGEPHAQRFRLRTVSEILAASRPEWLVKGLLPKAQLGVVYGASGSGKTFWTLDLMLRTALGWAWGETPVKPHRVIYFAAEGQAGFRNRLEAFVVHHRLPGGSLDDIFRVVTDVPDLRSMDWKHIAAQVRDWRGADIIVIDTLAQTTPGADENSAKDLGEAMQSCRRLHEATGALILLVHHTGKDPTKGARGSSVLKAGLDVEIEIVRADDARHARVTKQKDGEDGGRFGFRLQEVVIGEDEAGELITSIVVEQTGKVAPAAPRLGRWQAAVLEAVQFLEEVSGGPVCVADVLSRAIEIEPHDPGSDDAKPRDRRKEKARTALRELIEQGRVGDVFGRLSIPRFHKTP